MQALPNLSLSCEALCTENVLRTLLYTTHSLNQEHLLCLYEKSSCFSFQLEQRQQSYHLVTSVLQRLEIGIEALFICCFFF